MVTANIWKRGQKIKKDWSEICVFKLMNSCHKTQMKATKEVLNCQNLLMTNYHKNQKEKK
jgi:hypothetical protein